MIALIIYCTFLGLALLCVLLFGCGNLDRIKMTGPYQVGHKEMFCRTDGSAVSIYYPMDIAEYDSMIDKKGRNTYFFRNGIHSRRGVSRATAPWGKEEGTGPWFYKFLDIVRLNTVQDGEIADDFKLGKKLIPIIFSHGLTCNRTSLSGLCRDFASHGYIVLALDHHDGTAYFSRKANGEELYWSSLKG